MNNKKIDHFPPCTKIPDEVMGGYVIIERLEEKIKALEDQLSIANEINKEALQWKNKYITTSKRLYIVAKDLWYWRDRYLAMLEQKMES